MPRRLNTLHCGPSTVDWLHCGPVRPAMEHWLRHTGARRHPIAPATQNNTCAKTTEAGHAYHKDFGRQADRQTGRQADRQAIRQTVCTTYRQASRHKQTDGQAGRLHDIHIDCTANRLIAQSKS